MTEPRAKKRKLETAQAAEKQTTAAASAAGEKKTKEVLAVMDHANTQSRAEILRQYRAACESVLTGEESFAERLQMHARIAVNVEVMGNALDQLMHSVKTRCLREHAPDSAAARATAEELKELQQNVARTSAAAMAIAMLTGGSLRTFTQLTAKMEEKKEGST